MSTHAQPAGRRALAAAAVAGACLTAMLGLAAEQTRAASTPRVQARVHAGTLEITGTPVADTIALRWEPAPAPEPVAYKVTRIMTAASGDGAQTRVVGTTSSTGPLTSFR